MSVSPEVLGQVVEALKGSLSPDVNVRKSSEKFIETSKTQQGFSSILLTLVNNEQLDAHVRQAASITFKNLIVKFWIPEGGSREDSPISENERNIIKENIVGLMLNSPKIIRDQVNTAMSTITEHDFHELWPNLLPELISKLNTTDMKTINGVLNCFHSIFRTYRYQYRTDKLFLEIAYVLKKLCTPFTELFVHLSKQLAVVAQDLAQSNEVLTAMRTACKVFYSLNFQDIPEFFEDNMNVYMPIFKDLLGYQNALVSAASEDEAGNIELLKASVCECLHLYLEKYDELFSPFVGGFVETVWHMLISMGAAEKYDLLASAAIKFLAAVSASSVHHGVFQGVDAIKQICELVIIPNMHLRDVDEELFEDNPVEYIRRDIEGSDADTRRRTAFDLVKGLCKFKEAEVTGIFSNYINTMLAEYAKSPATQWKMKECAVFLVTALAARGNVRAQGLSQVSSLVNIVDFFNTNVLPELQDANIDNLPVLKASCIKFAVTFRQQLSKEACLGLLPIIIRFSASQAQVLHTYAAHCLERFCVTRDAGVPRIAEADVQPHLQSLLENLFNSLAIKGSEENEYVMKAIMRIISVANKSIGPLAEICINKLNGIVSVVAANPKTPAFNHFLFETIAVMVRNVTASNPATVDAFEKMLFPPFQQILGSDVQEFMPYVFQILSLLLEIRPPPVSQMYLSLFPPLLLPAMWENTSNAPAMVRLLQAYVKKAPTEIVSGNYLEKLLGVFQKLIASKLNDHEGFYLLGSIIEHIPANDLANYLHPILQVLLNRLQVAKTAKFVKFFILFLSSFVHKHGGNQLVNILNGMQPNLFSMLLEKVWIADVQKVHGTDERKTCVIGMSKLLVDSQHLAQSKQEWGALLLAIVKMFELPEDESVNPDEEAEMLEVDDVPGFSSNVTPILAFASSRSEDAFPDIQDPKRYFTQLLTAFTASNPGQFTPVISALPDVLPKLQGYCATYGGTLA